MTKDPYVSWIYTSATPMLVFQIDNVSPPIKNTNKDNCYNSDNISTFMQPDLKYLHFFKFMHIIIIQIY